MLEWIAPDGTVLINGSGILRLTFNTDRHDQGVYTCQIIKSTITFTRNVSFSLNLFGEFIDMFVNRYVI